MLLHVYISNGFMQQFLLALWLVHTADANGRHKTVLFVFTPPTRQCCLVSTQFQWVLSCLRRLDPVSNLQLIACSHRQLNKTRQFCLVHVGGVNKPLVDVQVSAAYSATFQTTVLFVIDVELSCVAIAMYRALVAYPSDIQLHKYLNWLICLTCWSSVNRCTLFLPFRDIVYVWPLFSLRWSSYHIPL